MRPRRTFTRTATCAVHGTSPRIQDLSSSSPNPPLHYLSPLSFEAQPLSSAPDLLGKFLLQGDRNLYKTRSPDATLQNRHVPFRHLLPSLTLCRQFALHCLVLSLPVRSLLLECGLPCPGYCACLVLPSMSECVASLPLFPWFSLQCTCPCSCVLPRRVC